MLQNYVTLALRTLKRYPGTTFINVGGLALGMACALVVMLFVRDELRYDRYHEKADRLYRLNTEVRASSSGELFPGANSALLWAPVMQQTYPEIEAAVRFVEAPEGLTFTYEDRSFQENNGLHTDPAVFDLFSWKLVQGDPATALARPRSLVLTESLAEKYFRDENALGQTLTLGLPGRDEAGRPNVQEIPMTVTGVIEDLPRHSHFTFDFLLSTLDLNDAFGGDVMTGAGLSAWYWRGLIAHTYVLLRPGATPESLVAKAPDFLDQYVHPETRSRGFTYALSLQPIEEIYLGGQLGGQMAPVGDWTQIYMFSLIAFFLLLIACVNFVNLATARAMRRAREVGLRKVLGAQRKQLVGQFLGESVLLSLLAALGAVALAWALLPVFYHYLGREAVDVFVVNAGFLVAGLLVVLVVVGVGAGSYPAFVLSRFQPARVLKGPTGGVAKGVRLRQGLVVFQFVVSIVLIVATLVVYRQLVHLRTAALGFDQEQIVFLPPNTAAPLKPQIVAVEQALSLIPQVEAVTAASGIPGTFPGSDVYNERGTSAETGQSVAEYWVDYDFAAFFGLSFLAGRDFSLDLDSTPDAVDPVTGRPARTVIVNEEFVRTFGWGSPEAALGRQIARDPNAMDFIGTIVGVVRDFHYNSLLQPIGPLVLILAPESSRSPHLALRLRPDGLPDALRAIETTVASFAPETPFTYTFLDEHFRARYEANEREAEVFGYVALLAVVIACLGLFALAAYTAEQRRKEIGMRKVLGASVSGLVALLSWDFLRLVLVAFVLAAPIAYVLMQRWLEDFAYPIPLGPDLFLLAGLLTLLIAFLTVGTQARRAALTNPASTLRSE